MDALSLALIFIGICAGLAMGVPVGISLARRRARIASGCTCARGAPACAVCADRFGPRCPRCSRDFAPMVALPDCRWRCDGCALLVYSGDYAWEWRAGYMESQGIGISGSVIEPGRHGLTHEDVFGEVVRIPEWERRVRMDQVACMPGLFTSPEVR